MANRSQMSWQRLKSLQATFADIRTAVEDNAKQRFSMKPNASLPIPPSPKSENPSDWVIRANQGHSIAIESSSLLTPITLESGNIPNVVVHGTYYAFYQPIVQSGGLKKGARNHIHFSTGLPEDNRGVISGMRSDTEMLIYVDIKKSLEDGYIKWWLSENGVVLTEGDENGILGTKYFKKVEGRRSDCGVLWEDGEEIAELPLALRNRKAPQGKGPKGARGGEKGKPRGGGPSKGKDVKKSLDDLGGDEVLNVNKP